jgi:hypothetical protein
VERLPGLGCHAEGQLGEVGVIGCGAVKARVRPAAIVQVDAGTPTGLRSVKFFIVPWSGCVVHVHEAIDKANGAMVRCSRDDASGRWLELPIWMFDRASCALIEVVAAPRVDLTALGALIALLRETERADGASSKPAFGRSNGHSQPESGRDPCDG